MAEGKEEFDEKAIVDQTQPKSELPARRDSRSIFAPVVLIGAGVLFLLENIGIVGELDWAAAWRYWPLALIFLGLNVLVVQVRPPLGTALSGVIGLGAVAVLAFLLLGGAAGITP